MQRRIRKQLTHIGRRGATLLFFALLFCGTGLTFIFQHLPNSSVLNLLVDPIPQWVWGVAWLLPGIQCIIGALHRKCQPLAFGLTVLLLNFWAILSLISFIGGDSASPLGFLVYVALALLAFMISDWKENDGT